MIFSVEVEEILQKVVDIEAKTIEEAIEIAKQKYRDEEIVLESEDIKETTFEEYKDEVEVLTS